MVRNSMPAKELTPNFEGIARVHPIINIVLAKNNPTTNYRLTEFLHHEHQHKDQQIPYTLHQFYGDYLEYAVQRYTQDNRQRSRFFPWNYNDTIEGLARLAYYSYITSRRLTTTLIRKHLDDLQVVGLEKPTEAENDVEFRSLGLLALDETVNDEVSYRFREQIIVEYLVARFIIKQFSLKLFTHKASRFEELLTPNVLTCIDRLPLTGDVWRITFGLLNSDDNSRTIQAPLLYELVDVCKTKDYLNSFEITSLCVEAIYESQNAGELSELLDEFTLNQTINYANVPVIKQRYLYTVHAVGYLVRASPCVYGVHLNNVGLNEDRVALLADPINEVSDNNLQVLNISNNPLGDGGLRRLQRFIVKATLLSHLDLSSCDIGNLGIAILAEFFMCVPLRYLRLADNRIGDAGMIRVAANFKYLPTLEWLDVSSNLLTDISVAFASTELHHLPVLRSLDLRRNYIGDVGLEALSRALRSLPLLQQVMLAENTTAGDGEATQMAEHAWKTKSLRQVNMNLSQVPMQGVLTMRRTTLSMESLPSMEDEEVEESCLNDTMESGLDVSLHFQPTAQDTKQSMVSVDLLEGRPDRNKAVYLRARSSATLPSRRSLRRSWHGVTTSFRESFRQQRGDLARQKWDSTCSALAPPPKPPRVHAQPEAAEDQPREQLQDQPTAQKPEPARLTRAASFRKSLTRIGANIRNSLRNRFTTSDSSPITRKRSIKGNKTAAGAAQGTTNHTATLPKETAV